MDIDSYLEQASPDEVVSKLAALAASNDDNSVGELCQFLSLQHSYIGESGLAVSRLACRALLQKGAIGIEALSNSAVQSSFEEAPGKYADVLVILETLWYVAHGQLPPYGLNKNLELAPPLDNQPPSESILAAQHALQEIVEESQLNDDLLTKLVMFLVTGAMNLALVEDSETGGSRANSFLRSVIFEVFTEPAIKITRRLVTRFEILINEPHEEEVYQQFLRQHPVFIDPLASQVIPKQKLGVEHFTDFVVRRLDNEYIVVEIERPHDPLFTGKNDFTARFTHAYGQVIDFQEWVDAHGEYARSLMPGISSPRGMLLIGSRKGLTAEQAVKLRRFNINSRSVEVFTYDDLLAKAKDLYNNIHTHAKPIDKP